MEEIEEKDKIGREDNKKDAINGSFVWKYFSKVVLYALKNRVSV